MHGHHRGPSGASRSHRPVHHGQIQARTGTGSRCSTAASIATTAGGRGRVADGFDKATSFGWSCRAQGWRRGDEQGQAGMRDRAPERR